MRKRNHALLKTLFVITASLFFTIAQAKNIPGQIIDNEGKVTNVTFKIPFGFLSSVPDFLRMQTRVAYYDDANQKHVLHADKAQEIKFVHANKSYRMLSRYNEDFSTLFPTSKNIFMLLEIDGKLKLFHLFSKYSTAGTGTTPGYTYSKDQFYLQRSDSRLLRPRDIAFRKDMTTYLDDCPEVVKLVQERELRKAELVAIVNLYNQKCTD